MEDSVGEHACSLDCELSKKTFLFVGHCCDSGGAEGSRGVERDSVVRMREGWKGGKDSKGSSQWQLTSNDGDCRVSK